MKVTIVTPSYNKPRHLREAGESILAQSLREWVWWLILDGPTPETRQTATELGIRDPRVRVISLNTTDEERKAAYRPAVIFNEFYPQIDTPYIFWLSDDDLIAHDGLTRLVRHAERTGAEVVLGRLEGVVENPDRSLRHVRFVPRPGKRFGPGRDDPCKKIDGGQVLHTSAAYRACEWQSPTDFARHTDHTDGLFLRELARRYEFIELGGEPVVVHRCTPLSTWNKTGR